MIELPQAPQAPQARASEPPFTLQSFADSLYGSLEPLTWQDDLHAWALADYCQAIGMMFQAAEDLARDTEEGPGWSSVLDLERCPDEWLPWLAQFVGVTIPGALTGDDARAWIAGTDGFQRGTPEAIRNAAAATLTSSKTVVLRERNGSAYRFEVITYEAETPSEAFTRRALEAQKPAGLLMEYRVQLGADYEGVRSAVTDYADLKATYATYREARDTPLGE